MAVRPQGKRVRVLYDYEYKTSEGRGISIKEGDTCLLLKKTNSDWWSVIKDGEKKPIYVPANYVAEIRESKKKGRLNKHGSVEDVADDEKSRSSSEDLLQDDENALENGSGSCDTSEHDSDSIRNKLTASEDSIDKIVEVDEELEKLEGSKRVRSIVDKYEAPEYENLETIQAEIRKKRQESEADATNISSIQAAFRSPPPIPGKGSEPVRTFANDWEMFHDPDSGRPFYYNRKTKECAWKPPRGLRAKDSSTSPKFTPAPPPISEKPPPSPGHNMAVKSVNSFGTAVQLGSTSDGEEEGQVKAPVPPKVPSGWAKETTEEGDAYINEVSNEKSPSALEEEQARKEKAQKMKPVVKSEKEDRLYRTKITDSGKKVKKNWCTSYVYLCGSTLYFYKDQKAAQKKSSAPWGRPDEVIDLHGASVDLNDKEKTSRKNTILLSLLSGTQWLLQSDDQQKIQSWYGILCHSLAQMPTLVVARGSQESLNQSSDSLEQLDDDSLRFKRKKSRKEKEKGLTPLTEKEKTNTLDDPNLTFPEKSGKIKDKLRNFFGQRPEKRTLQAKGIIKEVIFGANLLHLADREKTPIPRFLQQVIVTIEERGLGVDGIYRVSGNLAQIIKLRHMVDQNEKYDFDNPDWDIHVLTGSLKLFFRELMEPLYPFQHFEKFLTAIKLPDRSAKVRAFKDIIKTLPKPNKETMRVLFKHLNKVVEHSRENRMQTQNVAIVFGPTLMWPERETQNVAVTTVFQSQIVELMLLEYKTFF